LSFLDKLMINSTPAVLVITVKTAVFMVNRDLFMTHSIPTFIKSHSNDWSLDLWQKPINVMRIRVKAI